MYCFSRFIKHFNKEIKGNQKVFKKHFLDWNSIETSGLTFKINNILVLQILSK
jgi:hypothetical protein